MRKPQRPHADWVILINASILHMVCLLVLLMIYEQNAAIINKDTRNRGLYGLTHLRKWVKSELQSA